MKFRHFMYSSGFFATLVFGSCSKSDDELNSTDRDFMTRASIGNTAEVGTAGLALNRATNPAVKAYAQSMMMEHNLAQTDLKNLGAMVSYPVKDTLDPAHIAIATQLSTLSGRAFDSAYIYSQVMDHQMSLTNFQTEQNTGQHRDVKNYANNYSPHIQMHLTRADSIATSYFRR